MGLILEKKKNVKTPKTINIQIKYISVEESIGINDLDSKKNSHDKILPANTDPKEE
jgi:hypothetical protein